MGVVKLPLALPVRDNVSGLGLQFIQPSKSIKRHARYILNSLWLQES